MVGVVFVMSPLATRGDFHGDVMKRTEGVTATKRRGGFVGR